MKRKTKELFPRLEVRRKPCKNVGQAVVPFKRTPFNIGEFHGQASDIWFQTKGASRKPLSPEDGVALAVVEHPTNHIFS